MEFDVDLDKHHLEGLAGQPSTAILELIWNALDADAKRVEVSFGLNDLEGIEEIRILDDGHGMTRDEAVQAFSLLGASWKQDATATRSGERALHGKHGRGRFRAGGIGRAMRWESVSESEGGRQLVTVEIESTDLRHGEVSEPQVTDRPVGTRVLISGIAEQPEGLGEAGLDRLLVQLAIYLEKYHPTVVFNGTTLDPTAIQKNRASYDLEDDARLDVIEWTRPFPRALYLCSAEGMALADVAPGIQAPGFNFTAYLQWQGFEDDARVLTAELDPVSGALIESARERLRHHFRERADVERRTQVAQWKSENVYPFEDEPGTEPEEAARELFDVVAVTARATVNAAEASSKRLSLNLLRQALEQNPSSLRKVFREVLELPEDKLKELDELLSQTSLANAIALSRSLTNRLDFLKALEEMVFEPELRNKVLERRELHRILAGETWVFGEEFNLTADDESLRTALKRHIQILDRDQLAPVVAAQPVPLPSGQQQAIVDLMLARSVPQGAKRREHLVVELKRPSVKVGPKELQQIREYALAVARDSRFDKTDVQWDFYVISGELAGTAIEEVAQGHLPPGQTNSYEDGRIRVWAKTWGEVMEDASQRLKFVQTHLGYDPSAQQAFKYLRTRHAQYVGETVAVFASEDEVTS